MEKLFLRFSLLSIVLHCLSCSPNISATLTSPLDFYTILSGANFNIANRDEISGSGQIRFTESLASASMSFRLKANLLDNGSSLTLITYAANPTLSDGIKIKLYRSGINVYGTVQINSGSIRQISSNRLSTLLYDKISLIGEIQNSSTGVRVLLWSQSTTIYSPLYALVDSDNGQHLDLSLGSTTGQGFYWGIDLDQAHVSQGQQGPSILRN